MSPEQRAKARAAVLAAAEHIETFPDSFEFNKVFVPATDRSCGCAIGWINFWSGTDGGPDVDSRFRLIDALPILGIEDVQFYERMRKIDLDWKETPERCALALREYAARYLS